MGMYLKASQGLLDPRDAFVVDARHLVGGSGVLQMFDHPATLAIEDLATLMINVSDNVATNIIIDLVGMDYVNDLMDRLGVSSIRLRRKMIDNVAAVQGRENTATMRDAADLMRRLHAGQFCEQDVCDQVLRILKKPKRTSPVAMHLPAEVVIANKSGGLEGVSCELALILLRRRPYVFCCAVNYSLDEAPASFVAELSHDVYRCFSVLDRSTTFGRRLPMADLLAEAPSASNAREGKG